MLHHRVATCEDRIDNRRNSLVVTNRANFGSAATGSNSGSCPCSRSQTQSELFADEAFCTRYWRQGFPTVTYPLRRMMFLLLGSFFTIDEGGRTRNSL